MNETVTCPVCKNVRGAKCRKVSTDGYDSAGFDCEVCGKFELSGSVFAGRLHPEKSELTSVQRAALSHYLRTVARGSQSPVITTDWLLRFLSDCSLPSPAIQATNAIRYIGDEVSRTGEPLPKLSIDLYAIIGAPNPQSAVNLVIELDQLKIVKVLDAGSLDRVEPRALTLTLDGWERYESEKRGQIAGTYGFLAMKFGDMDLNEFVKNMLKPAIREGIGFDLIDIRNVARAGIIDNIMRAQIRDAAFVIVDLTHDNSGAYWEAGYAEGLGKPVIYICERGKFEEASTHFDTNHCTTVLWSMDHADNFRQELIATLRRSLNLFPEIP